MGLQRQICQQPRSYALKLVLVRRPDLGDGGNHGGAINQARQLRSQSHDTWQAEASLSNRLEVASWHGLLSGRKFCRRVGAASWLSLNSIAQVYDQLAKNGPNAGHFPENKDVCWMP